MEIFASLFLAVSAVWMIFAVHQTKLLRRIMANQAEAAQEMRNLKAQAVKIADEIAKLLAKINELLAIIAAGGEITPELQGAIDELKVQMQVVDDLNPDTA